MDDNKKLEIKNIIDSRYNEDKNSLCKDVMEGYIFGKYSHNEHYSIDEIINIYNELYLEKNPLPVVEEVVEEEVINELIIE